MFSWQWLTALSILFSIALGDNIECFVGSVTPGMPNAQIAQSNLCSNCNYCVKLSGTLGGAMFQYRGCGCMNQQYPYTCSSRQTQDGVSNVPGFTGSAYCCTGNRCNSAISTSSIVGLVLVSMAAFFR